MSAVYFKMRLEDMTDEQKRADSTHLTGDMATAFVTVGLKDVDAYCQQHQALIPMEWKRCWAATDSKTCTKRYSIDVTPNFLPRRYR